MNPASLNVQHRYATLNGIQLHWVERGSGPLVILLHGFPEMWWCWRHQIPVLAEAGFRVIAPDLRGYNDSEKKGPYDIDTLAADILALIEAAGEKKAIVIGHDWGGAIAWHFASQYPEACEKLIVLNCPHPAMFLRALRSNPSQIRKSWYVFAFQIPWLPELLLTRDKGALIRDIFMRSAVDSTHFNDEEIAPFREAICKPGAAKAAVGYYRALVRERFLKLSKSTPLSTKVACPTLLIWAKQDFALDYEALVPGTERYVPGLQIKTLERCGHFVQEEQPEKINLFLKEFISSPHVLKTARNR